MELQVEVKGRRRILDEGSEWERKRDEREGELGEMLGSRGDGSGQIKE